jgi:hypothetical protein
VVGDAFSDVGVNGNVEDDDDVALAIVVVDSNMRTVRAMQAQT